MSEGNTTVLWVEDAVFGGAAGLFISQDELTLLQLSSEDARRWRNAVPSGPDDFEGCSCLVNEVVSVDNVAQVRGRASGTELVVQTLAGHRVRIDLFESQKLVDALAQLKERFGFAERSEAVSVVQAVQAPAIILVMGLALGGLFYAIADNVPEGAAYEVRGRRALLKAATLFIGTTLGTTGVVAIFGPIVVLSVIWLLRVLGRRPQVPVLYRQP